MPSFPSLPVFKAFALLSLIAGGLSGCGGGGADANAGAGIASSLSSTALGEGGHLVISEVATNYFRNDVAWVEVFNRGSEPVDLSSYTLRSSHLRLDTGVNSLVPLEFSLPRVLVPAGAYLVVAGKIHDKLQNSSQMVYVENNDRVPFWNTNGSLELVKAGDTADFVRFGSSMASPLAENAWNGRNVDSLPSGANEHGKSIVRLASNGMADTNTGADWSLVNFATPAGVNDIAPGVVDSDLDGIPDSAKIAGGTYAGLDLHAMGARPGRRDIFVEIDYMKSSDPALTPRREALQKIVAAFAAKNIALHLDTGALHAPAFDPALFNLGGGNAVDFASCVELAASGVTKNGCVSL